LAEDDLKNVKTTNALTAAIKDLGEANEGLVAGFAEVTKSKYWTVISRFASGTQFWRLQNYIRALGNISQIYTERLNKQRKAIIDGLESNIKLADSYAQLKDEMKDLEKSPSGNKIYKMIKDTGVGHEKALDAAKEYYRGTKKEMGDLIKFRNKKLKTAITKKAKDNIFNIGSRFDEHFSQKKPGEKTFKPFKDARFNYLGSSLQFAGKETLAPLTKVFGKTKDFFVDKGPLGPRKKDGSLDMRFKLNKENASGMRKLMMKIKKFKFLESVSKFATIGLAVLGKAIMYFALFLVAITVVVGIIRKLWPFLKEAFNKNKRFFEKAWGYLRAILYDFYQIFKAVWEGDFLKVLDIYFTELLPNIFMFLGNLVWGLGKVLIGLVKAGFNAVIDYIVAKLFTFKPDLSFIPGLHTGGLIKKGGVAVVGERGPELVNLPRGARVHSNAQSQAMMGHTINIHVNGRVGATDAEIKDIANKLSAEMNRRINRTNRSVNAF
tara:strand:+ start:3000 stop:4478 length:1479 start_codon:yes stop_codon:yes gene_type:complete